MNKYTFATNYVNKINNSGASMILSGFEAPKYYFMFKGHGYFLNKSYIDILSNNRDYNLWLIPSIPLSMYKIYQNKNTSKVGNINSRFGDLLKYKNFITLDIKLNDNLKLAPHPNRRKNIALLADRILTSRISNNIYYILETSSGIQISLYNKKKLLINRNSYRNAFIKLSNNIKNEVGVKINPFLGYNDSLYRMPLSNDYTLNFPFETQIIHFNKDANMKINTIVDLNKKFK